MFRLISAAAVVAGSLSLVAAQSYADFTLDLGTPTTFAGTVNPLGTFNGDVETNRAACDAIDNCIGFICQSAANNCILLAAGETSNSAAAGFDSIHWRFDTPTSPSCDSAINTIPASDGFCVCDFATQNQDSPFGCLTRLALPSQAAARRRIARNRIMPGLVKKAFFEEQRTRHRSRDALEPIDM